MIVNFLSLMDALLGATVIKLGWQIMSNEFNSDWLPHTSAFVTN